jgi:hypothetical protein
LLEGLEMKQITPSAHIGDSGIALIHVRVNEMDFVWHERKTDAGIDGEIELRDPSTGAVANQFLLVQSKASSGKFPGETDERFHFICEEADLDYWMQADDPVLLVCSHPRLGEAWWMHIQGWFADPSRRASHRIDFDKSIQRFDKTAARRLWNIADPHGHAHTTVPARRREQLVSNVIPIQMPESLYSAKCDLGPRGVYDRMREAGHEVRHDWIVSGGRLISWLPPEESGLRAACKGSTDPLDLAEWTSTEEDRSRDLVQLLNGALKQDVSRDCDWFGRRRIVFFRATDDLSKRSIHGPSGRPRQVFHPVAKKRKKDEIAYYKHVALYWQFILEQDGCFCALIPTYHYTYNGVRESRYAPEYLAGIKRRERNLSVLGQTKMWAHYLAGEVNLLEEPDLILGYGPLELLELDAGIDDDAWLPQGEGSVVDLRDNAGQTASLFEVTA